MYGVGRYPYTGELVSIFAVQDDQILAICDLDDGVWKVHSFKSGKDYTFPSLDILLSRIKPAMPVAAARRKVCT